MQYWENTILIDDDLDMDLYEEAMGSVGAEDGGHLDCYTQEEIDTIRKSLLDDFGDKELMMEIVEGNPEVRIPSFSAPIGFRDRLELDRCSSSALLFTVGSVQTVGSVDFATRTFIGVHNNRYLQSILLHFIGLDQINLSSISVMRHLLCLLCSCLL